MKKIILLLTLALAQAQPAPPSEQPPEKSTEQPSEKTTDLIRLDGLWEIHVGGKNTGVELSIKQITERFHTTFSKPPANNPLGIKVGDDFLWGTLNGTSGNGHIFLVDKPDTPGGATKRTQAPARFEVNQAVERIRVEVNQKDLDAAMQRFELVRIGRIDSLRLYVKGPGEPQPAGSILENQLMFVEVQHTNPTPSPIELTIQSGANSIKLIAKPPSSDKAPPPGILHTEPFIATFADALGVPVPDESAAENKTVPGREPTKEDWKHLLGTWQVAYRDGVLGDVKGWMNVDEYGRCELRYLEPTDESLRPLTLAKATIHGETTAVAASNDQPALAALPKFSLEFQGNGINSEKIESPTVDDAHRLRLDTAQPKTVALKAQDFDTEVGITMRALADRQKVTLSLNSALPGGLLLWDWNYRADRSTARDRDGFGRAGILRRLPGEEESTIALASGRELWMRQGPQIIAAFSTDDQVALDDSTTFDGKPVFKYRHAELTDPSGDNPHKISRSGNFHRHLLIVAKNLPPPSDKRPFPDLLIGEGSGVKEYRILARGTEDDPGNSPEFKQAWHTYREANRSAASPDNTMPLSESEEEGLHVLAIINPGADPGPQAFTLAESAGSWNLLYGDMRGKFMIARKLADSIEATTNGAAERGEWEAVTDAFSPETIHLVVILQNPNASIKELKAVLAHNDAIIPYGKDPAATAPILLTPDPNDPKTYRSPPIHLVPPDSTSNPSRTTGDVLLTVKPGDTFKARIQNDSGFFIQPTTASAKVFTSPTQLNAYWKQAVKTAADLAGQPVLDWNSVTMGTADSVTNFIFVEFAVSVASDPIGLRRALSEIVSYAEANKVSIPHAKWLRSEPASGIRTLKISIGDHAAMLLLRDEFVRMMNEQHADWRANQSSPRMRAIYESQKRALANRQSPLSFIKIPLRSLPEYEEGPQSFVDQARLHIAENKTWWLGFETLSPNMASAVRWLGGDEVGKVEDPYLYQLFDPQFLAYKTRVKEDAIYFEILQWSAFCHAYREWGRMMLNTINEARGLSNGDVQGLRKLTGIGFEAVVARLVPKMMKMELDTETQHVSWVPDHLARAHIKSLGVLGAAAKAQEEYSDVDTTAMLAVAAIATMPLGGGGIWSALIAASVSTADLAYTVYHDVIQNETRRRDLEFEVGAGAVLGADRAADKESTIVGDVEQALSVFGAAVGGVVDGAMFARTARAMKTADLIEESADLLRKVDFADPAALRALSAKDKGLLAEMIRRSDELAAQGRFGEFPEEFLEVNRNRKSILNALDGSDEFSADALALTNKRREVLNKANDQPSTTWRDRDFEAADNALHKKIIRNEADIEVLEINAKEIKAKYSKDKPPRASSKDGVMLDEIEIKTAKLRNEIGDFKQRREVISSYRRPHIEVPKRQAEILRGEGLPPTRSEFDQIRNTRERVRDGRAPAAGDGLERVDLEAAGTRIDDLSRATSENIATLARANPAPGSAEARALDAARARLDDLKEARSDIDDLAKNIRPETRHDIPLDDAAYLSGERAALSAADEAKVVDAIVEANGEWSALLKKAEGNASDQLLMQKIHNWRRDKMNEALTEAMRETERALGLPANSIKTSAFGSTNLTSDFDISVNPPKLSGPGRGPELAVRRFQEKTRKLFGGRESGTVVDTNVYTDPVYTIFKGTDLEGSLVGITTKQFDTSRQFLFQQMSNVKYRSPAQWSKLRERILNGVPPQNRKAMADILDQAEGANHLAKGRIEAALKARGIDNPTTAQALRINNDLYADALESIDGYKNMIDSLKKAKAGDIPASEVKLPGFLNKPEMNKALAEAERLIRSGDPNLAKRGKDILDDLSKRAVLNMRNKQGEALYHASEAYQTEATINHVVKEMQSPPKKIVNAESILSGKHNLKPPKTPLSPDDYVNSYFENGANLVKELNAKHVLDEVGGTIPGHQYNDKAATKAAKYFIRQLDAASMAKLDMNAVKILGFPDDFTFKQLVEATVELEENRSTFSKFQDVLKKHNMTGEQYLERVLKAQEHLDTTLMGRTSLPTFVNDLRAAERSSETAASQYFRNAHYDPTRVPRRAAMTAEKIVRESREDFEKKHQPRLDELESAAITGRFLTADQEQELTTLRSVASAQKNLEETAAAARLSGVPESSLSPFLADVSSAADPTTARKTATTKVQEAALRHLAANPPAINATAASSLPTNLLQSLKLPPDSPSLTTPQLTTALTSSGQHHTVRQNESIDTLRSQVEAGRQVLLPIATGDTTKPTAWTRIHQIKEGHIIADDPRTGEPMSYTNELFHALTGNANTSVIIDPYRNPDGTYRDEPETTAPIIDLDAALPLPSSNP